MYRIKYVERGGDHHVHITHLGNDEHRWTRDEVIARINAGECFYTYEHGTIALLRIQPGGLFQIPYVQTFADGFWTNNLLALPPFPTATHSYWR